MRILVLGDFSILNSDDKYKKTFGTCLKRKIEEHSKDEVFVISRPNNFALLQSHPRKLYLDLIQFNPNIVILSIGFNDAVSHIFNSSAKKVIQNLPHIRYLFLFKIIVYLKSYFQIKSPIFYTEFARFKSAYKKIIENIDEINAFPILINILKPSTKYLNKTKTKIKRIKLFNSFIKEIAKSKNCEMIDLYQITENDQEMLLDDGYSISRYGHTKICKILLKKIDPLKDS